jgi:hypothetical protein
LSNVKSSKRFSLLNFASVLATENNTKVTISNLPVGTALTSGQITTGDIVITLNKTRYVLALENSAASASNSSK